MKLAAFWHKLSLLRLQQPQVHLPQGGSRWRQARTSQTPSDLLWIFSVGPLGSGSGAAVLVAAAGPILLALRCGDPQTILLAYGESRLWKIPIGWAALLLYYLVTFWEEGLIQSELRTFNSDLVTFFGTAAALTWPFRFFFQLAINTFLKGKKKTEREKKVGHWQTVWAHSCLPYNFSFSFGKWIQKENISLLKYLNHERQPRKTMWSKYTYHLNLNTKKLKKLVSSFSLFSCYMEVVAKKHIYWKK